jgi:CubicO group peptidase (beta-lactamase class C family)
VSGCAELIGENDMFRLASMTKAVISVAAMILIEQVKIGLDDPVSRFLPEFAKLRVRGPDGTEAPAGRPPTIRELLTQRQWPASIPSPYQADSQAEPTARGRHREGDGSQPGSVYNRAHCKAPGHPELCVQRT